MAHATTWVGLRQRDIRCFMVSVIKRIASMNPALRDRLAACDDLRRMYGAVSPGHFYSPIPSLDEVRRDEGRLFGHYPKALPGIDLNEEQQLELLGCFQSYYADLPFPERKTDGLRYFFDNPSYSYSDAIVLYCMLRYAHPKRVVEIGSGYSSAATLDTNELFFQNRIRCTFIDPCPDVLLSIMKKGDNKQVRVWAKRLPDVDIGVFQELEAHDIFFIDSTHTAKIGSDVNYLFGEILPVLQPGVYVHFHDVLYPFEYPKAWVYSGLHWNEAYMMRAFLAFNSAFKIVFFNTFLEHFHRERFERQMPLCLRNEGGSVWLQRTA